MYKMTPSIWRHLSSSCPAFYAGLASPITRLDIDIFCSQGKNNKSRVIYKVKKKSQEFPFSLFLCKYC